ncbi:MAG: hypothetical protein R3C19_24190 [Planctomycetaceae bacterium]
MLLSTNFRNVFRSTRRRRRAGLIRSTSSAEVLETRNLLSAVCCDASAVSPPEDISTSTVAEEPGASDLDFGETELEDRAPEAPMKSSNNLKQFPPSTDSDARPVFSGSWGMASYQYLTETTYNNSPTGDDVVGAVDLLGDADDEPDSVRGNLHIHTLNIGTTENL